MSHNTTIPVISKRVQGRKLTLDLQAISPLSLVNNGAGRDPTEEPDIAIIGRCGRLLSKLTPTVGHPSPQISCLETVGALPVLASGGLDCKP